MIRHFSVTRATGRRLRPRLWVGALIVTAVLGPACNREEAPAAAAAAPSGTIDGMLVGALRSCRSDDSCSGGACMRGVCTGLVDADVLWLQAQLGDRILARVADDPGAMDELLRKLEALALAPGRAPMPRSRAVALLARVDDPRALDVLVRAAGDRNQAVRLRALLALASRGRDVVAELAPLADDPSEAVRVELARSLGAVRPDGAVAILARLAQEDDGPAVRVAAVRSLGQVGTPAADEALRAVIGEGPGYLHHDAVAALGR